MKKRSTKIGTYDTAEHGWTLTGWHLSDPEQKLEYVDKPGGDGSWDMSTVLTDGIPRYKDRNLTVTLECSEGNRATREKLISDLVNLLDGLPWPIVSPDKPDYYLTGKRVHVAANYSDLAHAAVTITATCDPWYYKAKETIVELSSTDVPKFYLIMNEGRRAVVPLLIPHENSAFVLRHKGQEANIATSPTEWPALLLAPGHNTLEYCGTGTLTLQYREAVLR